MEDDDNMILSSQSTLGSVHTSQVRPDTGRRIEIHLYDHEMSCIAKLFMQGKL